MVEATINYWAVLAAAAVQMALGFAWYSKALFGKQWMSLMGWDMKKLEKEPPKGMGLSVGGGIAAALVMSYVLAHFADYAGANTWMDGVQAGVWIWVGFVATVLIGSVLWERKPLRLFAINAGYWLLTLAISGAIIGGWQ